MKRIRIEAKLGRRKRPCALQGSARKRKRPAFDCWRSHRNVRRFMGSEGLTGEDDPENESSL
jgi:hypothetical protein